MKNNLWHLIFAVVLVFSLSCTNRSQTKNIALVVEDENVVIPNFDADSAYAYTAKQVSFGPRVPNTTAHMKCGDYLVNKLEQFGAKITVQAVDLLAYDGTLLKSRNIIGSYKPELKKRIALFAHWDSRPWADNDPHKKNKYKAIDGANDGASGVGVLLEIARQLQQQPATLGVDIILLDSEDYGTHQQYEGKHTEEAWCLGSQYWSKNPHVPNYNARFGILLDMVGGKEASFYKEYYSEYYAKDINRKVWKAAHKLGYTNYFFDEAGGGVTDDHLFINRLAGIKTIDIISYNPHNGSGFDKTWHTVNDTMDNIEPNTLKAVGQTVIKVIYEEK